MDTVKRYYQLTKPGIIYANIMTATAGALLASDKHGFYPVILLAVVAGTALVIASGCVFNNYLDRAIDKKMARTRKRALVQNTIPYQNALVFGTVLGLLGFAVLWRYTNNLTVAIGLVGWIDYVIIYGIAKRRTVHGTLVGSIAGATSIAAGYCAVAGSWDTAATLLFLLMVAWQMPHFYGIAMFRSKDYKAAGLPVRPVSKGVRSTRNQIFFYIIAFVLATSLLTYYGYTGYLYLGAMLMLGLGWLVKALMDSRKFDDVTWGRKTFLFSLIVLLATSVLVAVGPHLP